MSMKHFLSLSLALALVESISFPAHADFDLIKNLKLDSSIETRSFSIDNATDRNSDHDDYTAETNYRVMLGGSFDLLDDVHGRLQLDKNALQGSGSGSITSVEGSTFFDNAYVKVDKVFNHVDLTVGRQFYGDPNDLVIYFGPQNDSILSITSLDAFRADADIMGVAKFQGIAGKLADNGSQTSVAAEPNPANSNSDTDVWGGEINTDKVIPGGNLAVYYYTAQIKEEANALLGNNTLGVYGLRINGDIKPIGGLGYNAEIIGNDGRNNGAAGTPAYDGDAYSLGLNYGHDIAAMPARAHIDYSYGSHNFAAVAPGRRFGIIWGEFTNTALDPSVVNGVGGAGVSNLKVLDGGLGVNPIEKLGIDLNAYRFMYDTTGANPANVTGNKNDLTSAGTEFDLILTWKHSQNVSFDVNAAIFDPGDALQNIGGTPTDPITELGADMKIKF